MKRFLKAMLILIYWVFIIIYIFKFKESKIAYLLFQLLLFLPFSICILIDKDPFVLLVIIIERILQIMICISFFVTCIRYIIINKDYSVLKDIVLAFSLLCLSISMVVSSFRILFNKNRTKDLDMLILMGLYLVSSIIDLIIRNSVTFEVIVSLIKDISLTSIMFVFLYKFPNKEIILFNSEPKTNDKL